MNKVNHINYPNDRGQIYCRKENKVITLDKQGNFWDKCIACPLFNGDYQGNGVECLWEDDTDDYSTYSSDPNKELLRVSKLIDSGKLKKY